MIWGLLGENSQQEGSLESNREKIPWNLHLEATEEPKEIDAIFGSDVSPQFPIALTLQFTDPNIFADAASYLILMVSSQPSHPYSYPTRNHPSKEAEMGGQRWATLQVWVPDSKLREKKKTQVLGTLFLPEWFNGSIEMMAQLDAAQINSKGFSETKLKSGSAVRKISSTSICTGLLFSVMEKSLLCHQGPTRGLFWNCFLLSSPWITVHVIISPRFSCHIQKENHCQSMPTVNSCLK